MTGLGTSQIVRSQPLGKDATDAHQQAPEGHARDMPGWRLYDPVHREGNESRTQAAGESEVPHPPRPGYGPVQLVQGSEVDEEQDQGSGNADADRHFEVEAV